jgi:hypothetical protein
MIDCAGCSGISGAKYGHELPLANPQKANLIMLNSAHLAW